MRPTSTKGQIHQGPRELVAHCSIDLLRTKTGTGGDRLASMSVSQRSFVEHFLQELRDGGPQPETQFDEERSLNVLLDGRALVDVGLEGGTVTGTRAVAEQDDVDRDPEPTTVTMVQAEGFDHAAQADFVGAGTITFTEATSEATDSDEREDLALLSDASPSGRLAGAWKPGLFGTMTHTSVEVESSDRD